MNAPAGKPERETAPGEPAVIRRLPEGVEYTLIKAIFINLPLDLPTLLWTARSDVILPVTIGIIFALLFVAFGSALDGLLVLRAVLKRPRSNPTMTSSSILMTGTAIRPVRAISSSRAAVSSATFFATNSMP